jgi:hypothetical protein
LRKKKRALDFPPDFTTHAFFVVPWLWPDSADFPPDVERTHDGLAQATEGF